MTSPGAGSTSSRARRLRILLLNWQDRENPQAGGAEVELHEILGRLAEKGHEIRAVVSGFAGAPKKAELDGIAIERVGGRYTYSVRARAAALDKIREWRPHILFEDINKIPLFTPLWSPVPVVVRVPHLFGTTAFREANPGLAAAVWALERGLGPAYHACHFQAISGTTKEDLVARGIEADRIRVIPPGVDHALYRPPSNGRKGRKAAVPTLLYVGRLKRYKGIEVLLRALALVREQVEDARLVVVGRGDDETRLRREAERLNLGRSVRFAGYISEREKIDRLREAWALAYPSRKEGWGIANVEAAACGTPVLTSDSPGLRESGACGLLLPHGDVRAWAAAFLRVLTEPTLRERLSQQGLEHAGRFSWDRAAEATEEHIFEAVSAVNQRPSEDL